MDCGNSQWRKIIHERNMSNVEFSVTQGCHGKSLGKESSGTIADSNCDEGKITHFLHELLSRKRKLVPDEKLLRRNHSTFILDIC